MVWVVGGKEPLYGDMMGHLTEREDVGSEGGKSDRRRVGGGRGE